MRNPKVRQSSQLLEWFPVNAVETLTDQNLIGLDMAQIGAFWILRLFCWKDGSVPDSAERLGVLCRCSEDEMRKVLEGIRHLLEPHPDKPGRFVMPLVEKDRGVQKRKHESRRRAGAARHTKGEPGKRSVQEY